MNCYKSKSKIVWFKRLDAQRKKQKRHTKETDKEEQQKHSKRQARTKHKEGREMRSKNTQKETGKGD